MNVNTEKLCNEVSCTLELLVLGYKRHWIVRVSHGFYSSHFTMLRATVLLCLVTSAVLTQSLASPYTAQGTDPIDGNTILDYPSDSSQLRDGSINDTLSEISGIPTCSADYTTMSIANRKVFQNIIRKPFAICVRSDGCFVATSYIPNLQYVYLFDPCGWVKKKIALPPGTANGVGCAFTPTNLFYSVTPGNKILQFTNDGGYQNDFAVGFAASRMATSGYLLYTSISGTKRIVAFDTINRRVVYSFFTTNGEARGLAFDRNGNLHVTTFGNVVELFTPQGQQMTQTVYPEIGKADGIAVDSNFYRIITDTGNLRQVLVFDRVHRLVRRITGFNTPADVALGNRCTCLIVADLFAEVIYLL